MTLSGPLNRILISSASDKLPLIRAMVDSASRLSSEFVVVAGDFNAEAISSFFDWEFVKTPETTDRNAGVFLELLLESRVRVVIPTRDGELEFWARHAETYAEAGISVVCSPTQTLANSLDKLEFFKFASGLGFPVIETSDEPDEIVASGIVVKERWGSGSAALFLDVSLQTAKRQATMLHSPIFQPYVRGQELSADVWRSRDGTQCFCSLRVRDNISKGEAKVTTTIRNVEVERMLIELANAIGLIGPGVVQLMLDKKGAPQIIEINPRFGGASTASIAAGFPILDLTLADFLGLPGPESQKIETRHIRQVRYPKDLIIEDPSF